MRNSLLYGVGAAVVVLLIILWAAGPDDPMVTTGTMPADDTTMTDETAGIDAGDTSTTLEDQSATETAGMDANTAEVENSDVGAASNAATDEAVAQIEEGDAPTSEEAVDESREIAAAEGVVGAEALQPDTFDMERVIEIMENSGMSEAEQEVYMTSLESVQDDPVELEVVLEDLRTALNAQ